MIASVANKDVFSIGKIMNSIKENTMEALTEINTDQLVESAEGKLLTFKNFRTEITASLAPIIADLEKVQQKFAGKAYSNEND